VTGSPSPARPTRRARRHFVVVVSALSLLSSAAPASADTFTDIYKDFAKDGAVDPCRFSAKQMRKARDQVTPDLEQYAPDFPAALDLAIEARANGNCKKAASTGSQGGGSTPVVPAGTDGGTGTGAASPSSTAVAPAATATPAPNVQTETPQPQPAPAPAAAAADGAIRQAARVEPTSGRSDGLPAAVVGLGTLAVLLLLTSLVWLALRQLVWEPRWMPRARHAFQEAGWRMSGTWADFTDWVRLGR